MVADSSLVMMPNFSKLRTVADVVSLHSPQQKHKRTVLYCTRNVEAFLEKTAIAYHPNSRKSAKFGWYVMTVFSKNATTLRV